jgi:hypothetical protein
VAKVKFILHYVKSILHKQVTMNGRSIMGSNHCANIRTQAAAKEEEKQEEIDRE